MDNIKQVIYLAGPDVFRPNAIDLAEKAKMLCAQFGHIGLSPVDSPAISSKAIFLGNIGLIKKATMVIANLTPFRGAEVDTGTAFEVGMAVAMGKRVIGYVDRNEEMIARVGRCFGPLTADKDVLRDENQDLVENFGNPVNLMIAESCEIVVGGLQEALERLDAVPVTSTPISNPLNELARYFMSGNNVPVERATIRAEDFWRIAGKRP